MIKRFFMKRKGNAAIEAALIFPFLLIILMGIFDFGKVIVARNTLNSVISAGLLYAFEKNSNPSAVETAMKQSTEMTPLTVASSQFCQCLNGIIISCSSMCSPGEIPASYTKVTAESSIETFNFFLKTPFVMKAEGVIRVK